MNPAMMKKLQKMQKDLAKAQREIEESIFKGTAGGGMVKVEVKGTKELVSLTIDPEAVEGPEDLEMLQDTIVIAINDAFNQVDEESNSTMGQLTGGMGGMGGLF